MEDQKPVAPPVSAAGTSYSLTASILFLMSGIVWAALTLFTLINRRGTSSLLYGALAVLFLSVAVVFYNLFRQSRKGND